MDDSVVFNDNILSDGHLSKVVIEDAPICSNLHDLHEKSANEHKEKNNAVWTDESINTLLRLYESKLGMLITPKKKTKIWIAISDNFKDYDIEVTPDQVRWKINALTKKYKQCIDSGYHNRFKYFNELNNIFAQYNKIFYATCEFIQKKHNIQEVMSASMECGIQRESKSIIELRKHRLADKIESDISQSKVQLEKQWLEYLKKEEEFRLLKDKVYERNLYLRQEVLELRKRDFEMKESLELRRLQLMEQEQEAINIEKEKCEIVKMMIL